MSGLGIGVSCALSVIFLGLGIASAAVYGMDSGPACGLNGPLSLSHWVLGSAVSYIFLGSALVVSIILGLTLDIIIVLVISLLLSIFAIPWTIVGALVWLKFGLDCATLNLPMWCMAVANVLTMIATIPVTLAMIPFAIDQW